LILGFTSCDEKEQYYPDPEIEFVSETGFTSTDTVLLLSDTITVAIKALTQSNVPLTHLHYFIIRDSEIVKVDTGIYLNNLKYFKTIVKGVSENEIWSFYVRDKDGRQSDTISISFTKGVESQYREIISQKNIRLGAQNNEFYGSFYSLDYNQPYSLEAAYQNQEKINLVYFYDFIDGDENTISSPGANIDVSVFGETSGFGQWSTKNTTRFIYQENITPEEFNACNNDSLLLFNSFEYITGKRKSKNLTANDIFSFVTDDGKRGLFMINSISGADEGEVVFSIKMQQ